MANEFTDSFFYCDEVVDDTTGKISCTCLSPDYSGLYLDSPIFILSFFIPLNFFFFFFFFFLRLRGLYHFRRRSFESLGV